MGELAKLIQQAQNRVLELAQLTPEGTPGREALLLAFESLRLSWYMMRGDRVGIAEKRQFVKLAYDRLMEEE